MDRTEIHGHEVMQMMLETDKTFTRDSLRSEIHRISGEYTRFFTCSANNLDADELMDFLIFRVKITPGSEGMRTTPESICSHE